MSAFPGFRYGACIFDLDGTLVDSEPNYYASDKEFLVPQGVALDDELNLKAMGAGTKAYMLILKELFPDSPFTALPVEEMVSLRDGHYLRNWAAKARVFPAMKGLVLSLSEAGMPLALASGSSRAVIESCLKANGLRECFQVIVASAEVPLGKPAPDIFLEAARQLGQAPADCLVFEDTTKGLGAAKAAGMACVVLPDPVVDLAAQAGGFAAADFLVQGGPAAATLEGLLDLVKSGPAPRARA